MKKRHGGFTLIELLIVIAIIILLLGLFGIVAIKMRQSAYTGNTKALIKRVHAAMAAYNLTYRGYPPTAYSTFPNPWPASAPYGGDLDITMLTNWEATARFDLQDYDPNFSPAANANGPYYLVDSWYVQNDGKNHRIQYRKCGPDRILIWSHGPNGTCGIDNDIYEMWPNAYHAATIANDFNISNVQIDTNSTNNTANSSSSD